MINFPLFPERASALAERVDTLFFAWLALSGTVALAIALLIVFFAVRYRHGSKVNRDMAEGAALEKIEHRFEVAWVAIPLVLFLAMFAWAAKLFYEHASAPADAMQVYVVGKQWMWHLQHAGGRREINELHVPAGRAVRLVMTSQDVIHSFFMPVFRVKQDVLPGRYTSLWFRPVKPGDYHVFCSQYCGTDHAHMIGHVVVMQPAAFERWLAQGSDSKAMAVRGAALYRQYGCGGCHDPGATVRAPPLAGLFGRSVELADGTSVVADERYIRDSVLLPAKEVTAGYAPVMPSFQGQIGEDDLPDLIEYIKAAQPSVQAPR